MHLGNDDTPVWMIWRNPETKKHEAILVAWHNQEEYNKSGFLSLKTFGTKVEAEEYLKDFWDSYWRVLG
jgi:hypothetical protein